MVRATLTMKVQAGREAAFEEEWRKVAEATRRAPGNVRQALLRAGDEPSTFVITSDWADRGAFGAFERSPEQEDLTAPLRALRESATMRVDELVAHLDAEGR
jgi:heme-degrading monooxygenase HmoA